MRPESGGGSGGRENSDSSLPGSRWRITRGEAEGYTDEEIASLTDQDNENDEYHTPVSPVDTWAEYARLRDEEDWPQEKIAKVKKVSPSLVSERIKWNSLPNTIKQNVGTAEEVKTSSKFLTEDHIRAVISVVLALELSPWLTSEQAWGELVRRKARVV